jgi:hypothetical protein
MKILKRSKLQKIKSKPFIDNLIKQHGLTRAQAKDQLNQLKQDEIWVNDVYQVNVQRDTQSHGMQPARICHISIKRIDKQPITGGWRDFQDIKNQIAGPDCDALEIYPAENRMVDTVNQYHLWAFPPGEMIPIGWTRRVVMNNDEDPSNMQQDHAPSAICTEKGHDWTRLGGSKVWCDRCGWLKEKIEAAEGVHGIVAPDAEEKSDE